MEGCFAFELGALPFLFPLLHLIECGIIPADRIKSKYKGYQMSNADQALKELQQVKALAIAIAVIEEKNWAAILLYQSDHHFGYRKLGDRGIVNLYRYYVPNDGMTAYHEAVMEMAAAILRALNYQVTID